MKKQTKLQELNRQRGALRNRFDGVKTRIHGLKYTSTCSDMMFVVDLNASISLVDKAFKAALADIDIRILNHKEFLYKSGARCHCGNRKLETNHRVEPTETITVYCSRCGNKWDANPEMKEKN